MFFRIPDNGQSKKNSNSDSTSIFCWESQKERDHWKEVDVNESIILSWIFERYRVG
jgi:hypothetical protein